MCVQSNRRTRTCCHPSRFTVTLTWTPSERVSAAGQKGSGTRGNDDTAVPCNVFHTNNIVPSMCNKTFSDASKKVIPSINEQTSRKSNDDDGAVTYRPTV